VAIHLVKDDSRSTQAVNERLLLPSTPACDCVSFLEETQKTQQYYQYNIAQVNVSELRSAILFLPACRIDPGTFPRYERVR
jgi:hypothetical protein